jgi:hypothetical protein
MLAPARVWSKPAGILAADIESTAFCGLDSVLRQMQTDARYCSRGWRVGNVSPRSYQLAAGQPQLIR